MYIYSFAPYITITSVWQKSTKLYPPYERDTNNIIIMYIMFNITLVLNLINYDVCEQRTLPVILDL